MLDLKELIDWDVVLSQSRMSGGHDEVMQNIFGKKAQVLAHWNENDYQGQVATAYIFQDGSVAFATDYYGSCSGCDSWEGATDEDARKLVLDIVQNNTKQFTTYKEMVTFLETLDINTNPQHYGLQSAQNLLPDLRMAGKLNDLDDVPTIKRLLKI